MTSNRRSFLTSISLASAGVALNSEALSMTDASPAPAAPSPCPPSAWRKHGIILEASESWESESIQNFTCPAEPLEDGRWRIWYSANSGKTYAIARAEGRPGEPMKKFPAICTPNEPADGPFTIGGLPEPWKPVQVVHVLLPN